MWGQKYQWISHKMNIWHPWQLKKSKSWMPFWSYQLNSTANPAHLPQNWAKLAKSAVLFRQSLQNGTQNFDFFNCHGCQYSFYVKFIATEAPTFFGYIISVLASVIPLETKNRSLGIPCICFVLVSRCSLESLLQTVGDLEIMSTKTKCILFVFCHKKMTN